MNIEQLEKGLGGYSSDTWVIRKREMVGGRVWLSKSTSQSKKDIPKARQDQQLSKLSGIEKSMESKKTGNTAIRKQQRGILILG